MGVVALVSRLGPSGRPKGWWEARMPPRGAFGWVEGFYEGSFRTGC
jgi:hypothetical protein